MRRVDKPWGHEIIWTETEHYAGKLLSIDAGHALSLQYHERKHESIYVLSGQLRLHWAAAEGEAVQVRVLGVGEAVDLTPGTVHRFEAEEAVVLLEVSTPDLDDVVRLADDYGRQGTSEP